MSQASFRLIVAAMAFAQAGEAEDDAEGGTEEIEEGSPVGLASHRVEAVVALISEEVGDDEECETEASEPAAGDGLEVLFH